MRGRFLRSRTVGKARWFLVLGLLLALLLPGQALAQEPKPPITPRPVGISTPITYTAHIDNGHNWAGSVPPNGIGNPDQWDYYTFCGTQGNNAVLQGHRLVIGMDPAMTLYSGKGTDNAGLGSGNGNAELTFLAFGDDNIPESHTGNGPFSDPQIVITLSTTGVYTLAIYDFAGNEPNPQYDIQISGISGGSSCISTVDLTPVLNAIARLEGKADRLEAKADSIQATVNNINGAVQGLQTAVGNLNAAVGGLHTKADRLEGKADRLETKLDQHMPSTAAGFAAVLQGIGVVGDAVNRLEGKADRLEAKADGIGGAVAGLHGKADRLEGKADRLEAKADGIGGAVAGLHGKADRLEGKADRLEAKADGIAGVTQNTNQRVGALQQAVAALESKADRLEAKADGANAALGRLEGKADRLEAKLDAAAQQTNTINANFSALVNTVIEKKDVDVQAVEVKSRTRWLLSTNEAGVGVDATLVSVKVSEGKNNQPLNFQNVTANTTATSAGPGLLDVQINLPNNLRDSKLFEFRVKHSDTDPTLGTIDHYGVTIGSHKDTED